jgi:hypothetical protein
MVAGASSCKYQELIILDDRQSAIQIKTLTDLKQSADSAASAATVREEEAKMGARN